MHFDGNYEGIRQMFYNRSGQDLNALVKELNEMSQFRDPVSRTLYKMIRSIKKSSDARALKPGNESINNGEQIETIQEQLSGQVSAPEEILVKDVEDITTQAKKIPISQQKDREEKEETII